MDLFKYLLCLIYSVVAGIIIGYFVMFDIFGGGRDYHEVHQVEYYVIHRVDLFKYLFYLIYSVVAGIIIRLFVIFDIFDGWEGFD